MAPRFSKNDRVLGLIAVLAVCSFGVGGLVTMVTSGQVAALETAKGQLAILQADSDELDRFTAGEQSALDDYVFARSAGSLSRFYAEVEGANAVAERIHAASGGQPDLGGSLEGVRVADLDWRANVATPAIAAVKADDLSALARFAADSPGDHLGVDSAADNAAEAFRRTTADLAARAASTAGANNVGIGIAFGFLAIAFGVALVAVRRFGRALERDAQQANVLNKFTEMTTFASEDREVAVSNLVALGRLARPDASVIHILNRSMDRAVPEASTGEAIAALLPLRALDRCAAVLRGTMYVADDLSDDLSVHCPVYPATSGTLACVPLDSGEMVGTVHLYWGRPDAFPLGRRPSVSRVTEHAALAIGNRRLLAALHGQANTDPRTGLANSRAFDLALEGALAARAGHEPLSVLMIDVDHFKLFNDRNGHPAGDEALRAFGAVLRSCMRDGDVAARYGGEEFAVLLPGLDSTVAGVVAERIRARTESTIIPLAPGMTDHITVSIGVGSAPDEALDRIALLRLADEALYRAKDSGRNRVGSSLADQSLPTGTDLVEAIPNISGRRAS